ncbi:TrmH family RNA methyltransferase [Pseudomarimonas salicorniae]|uniref:RNA methyltransferase n=1 Tax=Pseudomarimonas salicorniae TaxID=2933270 RepID=A0ABT0GGF7_9GAMM|nr:RNA methyltransferase [Lysobacter sp. CAU 1642]MCK7593620.1 RNA methyltransferase [Lysobacter sp. CAU 1642]
MRSTGGRQRGEGGGRARGRGDADRTAPNPGPGGSSRPVRDPEMRLYGLNACLVAFARRPRDLRKVYLSEARIPALREVLAWCVAQRIGYRVVGEEDLRKLAASSHHEGVVFDMRPPAVPGLETLLQSVRGRPSLLLWLDGVGNPHNLGAVLRSSAHFGVDAVLVPPGSGLALSGAACRVAEGGAEAVPLLRLVNADAAMDCLREAGFRFAATLPTGGNDLFRAELPERMVLVFGAEQQGMSRALVEACELRLGIPGSGAVESLNIASAAAVFLGEWRRRRG